MSRPRAMFRGRAAADGLRLHVDPMGWLDRPQLRVLDGSNVVLRAYVDADGQVAGWLSVWGIHGSESTEITAADIYELMGWTLPEGVQ